jgi:hypothetical protein
VSTEVLSWGRPRRPQHLPATSAANTQGSRDAVATAAWAAIGVHQPDRHEYKTRKGVISGCRHLRRGPPIVI